MKKLALLFTFGLLTLSSCTKDDSPTSPDNGPALLVKTITTGDKVTTLTYDGNKIVTIGDSETYTYTGDLITKKEATQNGTSYKFQYAYENGKLISELTSRDSGAGTTMKAISQEDYTYNSDGTVTAEKFIFNKNGKVANGTAKITFANGNIVKREDFYTDGTSTDVATYQYDDKINPLKNITGYSELLDPVCQAKTILQNLSKVIFLTQVLQLIQLPEFLPTMTMVIR